MDESDCSPAAALRRIAHYLSVPIESLFGSPDEGYPPECACAPIAEVYELVKAFSLLDDASARKRVIDAALAEVKAAPGSDGSETSAGTKKPAAANRAG